MHARFPRIALALLLLAAFAPQVAQGQRGAAVSPTAAQFAARAAASGIAEVRMSQLALDWAAAPAVRDFATQMLADHGQGNAQLEALARSKGIPLPRDPDETQRQVIARLSTLRGAEFDRVFVEAMRQAHEKDVALFESATSRNFPDPELRGLAIEMLPILRQHLETVGRL
ncbi:MAG: DUF4142 domain-containing protein [Steroidobacteraceae bacterium]|jgi:putative membrane protein|nr:DUF4142 domain-containing protein [Steroidobacteraceae bacterium]